MEERSEERRYDSILRLPHPTPVTRQRMSRMARAAQFAPFAALTGYDAAIGESARRTSARIERDEDTLAALDARVQLLAEVQGTQPEITVTRFVPDARKSGGAYVTVRGRCRRVDFGERLLHLTDGTRIPLEDIYALTGDVFLPCETEDA